MMKNVKKRGKKKEKITEEQEWYRMKMARYYEEEWNALFKKKSKDTQRWLMKCEKDDRVLTGFVKEVIKNADSRDWDDDNPNGYYNG